MHETMIIKVNCPVDKGVAPLVHVLNLWPDLITMDSCEDAGHFGIARSQVYFTYGETPNDLFAFCVRLSAKLATLGLCCGYTVSIEWLGDNAPRACLSMEHSLRNDVVKLIEEMAKE